ncbi:MAG: hypothetical protein ACYSWU_24645 [Planctomycetota bacterium]|jgi:DNA-binding transcriptional MerR regulator
MDLVQISQRSGMPLRTVRYVAERHLLPYAKRAAGGRGALRSFTDVEAVAVAIAATLLESGLRGRKVGQILRRLAESRWIEDPGWHRGVRSHNPLTDVCERKGESTLEVGDGVNVRLSHRDDDHRARAATTGWCQVETGAALGPDYEPAVCVRVDVAHIRERVVGG